mgnify:CR=1 FL=1
MKSSVTANARCAWQIDPTEVISRSYLAAEALATYVERELSIIDGIRLCKAERHRYANGNLDELEEEFEQIRTTGWSMQDEELAYGLRSIAAPVTGGDGTTDGSAEVGVVDPVGGFGAEVSDVMPELAEIGAQLRLEFDGGVVFV